MNLELIGKKLGMSQVYDEDNNLVPVTIVEAGPCPILQVKSLDKDGYEAIQIGFNPKGKPPKEKAFRVLLKDGISVEVLPLTDLCFTVEVVLMVYVSGQDVFSKTKRCLDTQELPSARLKTYS
jgi:ribosomal protein L3